MAQRSPDEATVQNESGDGAGSDLALQSRADSNKVSSAFMQQPLVALACVNFLAGMRRQR